MTTTKPHITGFCGPTMPASSHARCKGTLNRGPAFGLVPCECTCHQEQTATARDDRTGFHDDIPEADYHADRTSISVSGLKLVLKAPALYRWRLDHPEHKNVFDFGTAAHRKVLGVGADIVVHDYDPAKVKSPKATNAWKAQQEEVRAAGGVLLLPEEHDRVVAMADVIAANQTAMRLLSNGRPEVSAYALDEPTGLMRRGRLDWLSPTILTDYKSCFDASPAGFANAVARNGYDMQAAFYLDLVNALGHDAQAFAFIAQEKEPPFLCEVYELDAEFIDRGRRRYRTALERLRDCIETDLWPGYTGREFTTITAPRWATYDDNDLEIPA